MATTVTPDSVPLRAALAAPGAVLCPPAPFAACACRPPPFLKKLSLGTCGRLTPPPRRETMPGRGEGSAREHVNVQRRRRRRDPLEAMKGTVQCMYAMGGQQEVTYTTSRSRTSSRILRILLVDEKCWSSGLDRVHLQQRLRVWGEHGSQGQFPAVSPPPLAPQYPHHSTHEK